MGAVEMHGTIGAANATVSMIAEKKGVQRHTFYSHFPDEHSMLLACSGHVMAAGRRTLARAEDAGGAAEYRPQRDL